MRVLYVDHIFHTKTRSNVFLSDMLASHCDVYRLYVDPENIDVDTLIVKDDYDLVIVFQLDFLAAVFISQGIRTVVVPMYDGSELMPDLHWLWMRAGGCINFSRLLHERVRRLGTPSFLAKYYPAPAPDERRPKFDTLRVFLWQRRPASGINLRLVEGLFGSQLASVHLHNAPDDPETDLSEYVRPTRSDYKLTVSKWFDRKSDYDTALRACNVFIAPRLSEGIGQAFLEAMARGMLVLAHDAPTHDEYIANWINGVLFVPQISGPANFSNASQIAELGWRSVVDGYKSWVDSHASLVSFLQNLPNPKPFLEVDPRDLASGLCRSYNAGLEAYTAYLMSHAKLIGKMTGVDLTGRVTENAGYLVQPRRKKSLEEDASWLPNNRIVAGLTNIQDYVVSGRLEVREDVLWIVDQHVGLKFVLDLSLGVVSTLCLDCVFSPFGDSVKLMLCVSLNNWTVAMQAVQHGEVLTLDVPPYAVEHTNLLTIQVSRAMGTSDGGTTSFGLRRCDFN